MLVFYLFVYFFFFFVRSCGEILIERKGCGLRIINWRDLVLPSYVCVRHTFLSPLPIKGHGTCL